MSSTPIHWLAIGLIGQSLFTARFLVQWLASEKKRDSVMPVAFWWLSISGGLILFSYALYKEDLVFILGQSMGVFIYTRNLMLLFRKKRLATDGASATSRDVSLHRIDAGTIPAGGRGPAFQRNGEPGVHETNGHA